jgi:arylsulfatase
LKPDRHNTINNPSHTLELYDLSADVGETTDVAAKHPQIVSELGQIMGAAHTDSEQFRLDPPQF